MDTELAGMIADDLSTGPGADLGVTAIFEESKKRGRQAFTVANVPVSGIPYGETGRLDVDLENWTAQAAVAVASCPYRPDIGQRVTLPGGLRCRIVRCQPDPVGGMYAIELEPEARG
jgi:hypothetical protein